MLIDSHVHLPKFELATPEYEDALLADSLRAGVDFVIVSCLGDWAYYPAPGVPRRANQQAAAFVRRHPERARFLAYLDPQQPDWPAELERSLGDGAIGIKLWTSLKDGAGSLENTAGVLAEAGRRRLPVLLHVYNRTDGNLPGEIDIREFVALSRSHPDTTMIAAHAGGNWRQSLGMIKKFASTNAFLDISGGFPEPGMLAALVAAEGAGRVLYGSDFYGRSNRSQLAKLAFAELAPEAREPVAWRNAVRVFKLTGLPAASNAAPTGAVAPDSPLFAADHFIFCGESPFFPAVGNTAAGIAERLEQEGAVAYVADLGGMFAPDHLAGNRDHLARCRAYPALKALATFDPAAYNRELVLEDAATGGFAGGWLSPYAHGWRLDDPAHRDFFAFAARLGLPLWINLELGDHRFRHRAWRPRLVKLDELLAFLAGAPQNRYCLQGVRAADFEPLLERFGERPDLTFECSRLSDIGLAFEKIRDRFGVARLVYGSEYPLRDPGEVNFALTGQR
ncbi:MAG: amidohydrolase family protein [Victivallaceae bacterium]